MIWRSGKLARSDPQQNFTRDIVLKRLKIHVTVSFFDTFSYSLQDYDEEKRMFFEVTVNKILTYKNTHRQK